MDPFAHTLTGAALAASGLRRATPLATAALLIGVNAPDMDILVSYTGEYMSLAHRRGWTHGVLAWLVLPVALTALLVAWDRLVRRRRNPAAPPVQVPRLLAICTLAVLSHPALDWLNNYGIRLLMPFDGRWFYGDALFIIDPWVWLALGGACFLTWSGGKAALAGWGLLWGAATWLMLTNGLAPELSRHLWIAGLAGLLAWRLYGPSPRAQQHIARGALGMVAVYMAGNALASTVAEERVRVHLTASGGAEVEAVMVGPVPANPLRGTVVAQADGTYLLGSWDWLAEQPLALAPGPLVANLDDPVVRAAAGHPHAARFLAWSRFPLAAVEATAGGYLVSFGDARYAGLGSGISGPRIRLDEGLELVYDRADSGGRIL